MLPKRFVRDATELHEARRKMKLCRCPVCGRVGWLNAHGYLRGYGLDGTHDVMRGARFFCSNRRRRGGCDRTFSVMIASTLSGFVAPTTTVWSLLSAILSDMSCAAAWRTCCGSLSLRSGYRLWRRLREAQSSLRSSLSRRGPPPACDASSPCAQLAAHLRAIVGDVPDPLAAFQLELWQADTMVGPYVNSGAGHVQTRLIAFVDDASRVCCHGEFFASENTDSLIKAPRSALYKRGVPDAMYVDNGSIYTSKEIRQICTRIGCLLCHAPVRDGAAKPAPARASSKMRCDSSIPNA